MTATAQDQGNHRTLVIRPAVIQTVRCSGLPKRSMRDNTRITGKEHPTRFVVVPTGDKG